MVLVIDIGNTNAKVALLESRKVLQVERLDGEYSCDKIRAVLKKMLSVGENIEAAVISNVVPSYTGEFGRVVLETVGVAPLIIDKKIFSRLGIRIPKSAVDQIGSDIVCNALAASQLYPHKATIVTDFGTAMATVAIGAGGDILGVAIAPGIGTVFASLSDNTALLPTVSLAVPSTILGKDTVSAIQAGVGFGFKGMAVAILAQMTAEVKDITGGSDVVTVATGGVSGAMGFVANVYDCVEPELTLVGAAIALERASLG